MRTLLAFLLLFACGLPAQDDRDRTTPTDAVWRYAVDAATLSSLVSDGWRFTDLDISSSTHFNVAAVKNTGAYAKAWWYVIGVTEAQLLTTAAQYGARPIDLEAYVENGTVKFVAVMISNTGADQMTWWWHAGQTSAQVTTNLLTNNARLTCLERYQVGVQLQYATVMVANTGANYRPFHYAFNATAASINQYVATSGQRVYAIEPVAGGTFDVIYIDNSQGFGNWLLVDAEVPDASTFVLHNLARVVDFETYVVSGGSIRCAMAMLDRANPLEQRARQVFYAAPTTALGEHGFYLKEVNGPVLASMRPTRTFEPAGTMTTLYHAYAMRRLSQPTFPFGPYLNTQIDKPMSCGVVGSNQAMELTLRQMMENGDLLAALAVSNWFGLSNIDNAAAAFGMVATNINYTIGCSGPSPESSTTLADLSALHETVANGYLGSMHDKFYELMDESLVFPKWGTADLEDRIDAEALAIGMPAAVRDTFKSQLHIASRAGGLGWVTGGVTRFHYADGGWMSVPFRGAFGLVFHREYTFGAFNHAFGAQEPAGRDAMCDAELELVWDRVKAAMDSWGDYTPGSIGSMPGAGCAGSAGAPLHTTAGLPDLYGAVDYKLSNAPANALVVAMFGFSSTQWNGAPLPADLAPIGAPGCVLRTDPSVLFAMIASPAGTTTSSIAIGTSPALVGTVWYSQFLIFDPSANAFGATLSNAKKTTVGGFF